MIYCQIEVSPPAVQGAQPQVSFVFYGPETERKEMIACLKEYFKENGQDGMNFLALHNFLPVSNTLFYLDTRNFNKKKK